MKNLSRFKGLWLVYLIHDWIISTCIYFFVEERPQIKILSKPLILSTCKNEQRELKKDETWKQSAESFLIRLFDFSLITSSDSLIDLSPLFPLQKSLTGSTCL